MTPEWTRLERRLRESTGHAAFASEDLAGLPEPVVRYFLAGVERGTPAAAGARLRMRGRIKVGRWLPFRANQLLAPRLGTVWEARVAALITGSDRYVEGTGGMDWTLLGLRRIVHADGADVNRSAAERAAGESIWVPTALLPSSGVVWTAMADDRIAVELDTDGHNVGLEHEIDRSGRIRSSSFQRWGDPDNTGTWERRPFGVRVTGHRTFAGVTIPDRGRAGWHFGTDRWDEGVFFHFEITNYELVP